LHIWIRSFVEVALTRVVWDGAGVILVLAGTCIIFFINFVAPLLFLALNSGLTRVIAGSADACLCAFFKVAPLICQALI
jgi:hypothetical protein